MTFPLAENFDSIYFGIGKLVVGVFFFFMLLLALFGSIHLPYAPPKTWEYWIAICVLGGASAWCLLTLFR